MTIHLQVILLQVKNNVIYHHLYGISFLGQKRKQSCGGCPGCISEGCNECKFCLDKKKNSGPGLKRQCCVKRRCIHIAKNEADIDNAISQLCQLQDQYGKRLYSYNLNAMDSYTYIYICGFSWVMFEL